MLSSGALSGANMHAVGVGRRRPLWTSFAASHEAGSQASQASDTAKPTIPENSEESLPSPEEESSTESHASKGPMKPVDDDTDRSQASHPRVVRLTVWTLGLIFLLYQVAEAYKILPKYFNGHNSYRLSASASRYSYFIAQNLFNNEELFPQFTEQLVRTIEMLGTDNVYVSIFESGSTDSTPQHLDELRQILSKMKVKHEIMTVRIPWWKFCFAIGSTCSGSSKSLKQSPTSIRIPILSIFRNMALRPLYLVQSLRRHGLDDRQLFSNSLSLKIQHYFSTLQNEAAQESEGSEPTYLKSLSLELKAFLKVTTMSQLNSDSLWNPSRYERNLGLRNPIVILFINDILLYVSLPQGPIFIVSSSTKRHLPWLCSLKISYL
eukprot:gb/GECG01002751.1/.p1 GENE.gb/GECG01002751.1/~~gb/GECG01002751.1/.p1  ORF type:complete len:379 (+),score=36.08 gb/GECG01002751.1/:1-1137(+)